MRIGSLFTGVGGLDMAVQDVFGGTHAWMSEIDPAASKVLAHRFPGVPNLGDISKIDWQTVEPVDVLCGGFPCQDVSAAGKRAGIKDGTRSGLWSVFADAIDALRPQWVVIENVRGLLSATAERAVESGEDAVGDGAGRPVLRAAGAVLGDLADIGYDAQWVTVAAADVGAPHRRERVFILAADASRNGCGGSAERNLEQDAQLATSQRHDADRRVLADGRNIGRPSAAHSSGDGWDEGRPESARLAGGFDAAVSGDEPGVALLPTPTQSDGTGGIRTGLSWEGTTKSTGDGGNSRLRDVAGLLGPLLPTPRTSDTNGAGHHGNGGPDLRTVAALLPTPRVRHGDSSASGLRRRSPGVEAVTYHFPHQQWGKYEPAIARWEHVTGQPAPAPTEPNKNGNPRLSAAFSEWLMGWPPGWVTDPAIGISRNDQLRCVGNGVVSLQAAAAIRYLLAVATDTNTHTPGRADVTPLLPTPTSRDHKGANQRGDETCLHGAIGKGVS